eukprot:COSAG02_NODE_21824_length_773_cov_105.227003_2_plen_64_part_00
MLNFGLFAALVCVQVMCWAFGVADKLPTAMAEAGATSGTCVCALAAFASARRRSNSLWRQQAV